MIKVKNSNSCAVVYLNSGANDGIAGAETVLMHLSPIEYIVAVIFL